MQYFTAATIWGYSVLKNTGWLPWEIGGNKYLPVAFLDSIMRPDPMPYMKCPRPVLVYALGTMGYHFGDSLQ